MEIQREITNVINPVARQPRKLDLAFLENKNKLGVGFFLRKKHRKAGFEYCFKAPTSYFS